MENLRLTQFSPGAGCGCKISPIDLKNILANSGEQEKFSTLLVGNEENDDAAVLDLGNGSALISTTDFFTPIVDDPYNFGRIAATNAISDVYAMGGNPLMAIAILGWPLDKLPAEIAGKVVEGARSVCQSAGIPLAGGHSIDISDPVFGLAVTGIVKKINLKRNSTATPGCGLYLTKPLGVGIVTTAEKRGLAKEEHRLIALELMTKLNKEGSLFGTMSIVKAMTDVTGFGLGGHLLEMCEGSGLDSEISMKKIKIIDGLDEYIELKAIPGGTNRNFKSYGDKLCEISSRVKNIICDPQTSGGLLIAVDGQQIGLFENTVKKEGLDVFRIGTLTPHKNQKIRITINE
jgi:selenide, water dikinase